MGARVPVIVAALGLPLLAACGSGEDEQAAGAPVAGRTGCHAQIDRGVIPAWARTGFTQPQPRMPHVVGDAGRIAALVFGDPLTAPPRKRMNNKILWVSRAPQHERTDLRISAQRYGASGPVGDPVKRVVEGGPGPSIVDLPKAGCWHLELSWSYRTDSLDLRYRPRGS